MPPPCKLISDLYTHSPSAKPPLRIGLLVDAFWIGRPAAAVIREIFRSDFAQLEMVICNNTRGDKPSGTFGVPDRSVKLSRQQRRSALIWSLYNRFDRRVGKTEIDPLAMENCESMLKHVDLLRVAIDAGEAEELAPEALTAVGAKDLDLILHFGFMRNYGAIAQAARYGIWSLYYGDYDYYHGGPPYFWELYEQNPISGLTLLFSHKPAVYRVLAKAHFSTELGLFVRRNAARPFWGSVQLVMQKLWELHVYGWDFVKGRILPPTVYLGERKIYRAPTNTEVIRWFVPQATAKLCSRVKRTLSNSELVLQWQIAIRTGGRYICSADGKPETGGFQWLESPKGHFYADPFVVDRDGQHWLFFEDYEYQNRRGRIARACVSSRGELSEVRIVLEAASHLSYPYIFSDRDSLYMIPESGAENVVRLYRCENFPDRWTWIADLFHGPAFDTSICQHDGLWWFFTTLQDPRGHGVALYLFYSESLKGKWQYHPANPISYDVRNARNAGRLFESEGKLIRPSQSGVIRYGYSFALNEIVMLTPSEYEERTILTVEPFRNLMATHTYNREGSIEAIDGQRQVRVSRLRRPSTFRRAGSGGKDSNSGTE